MIGDDCTYKDLPLYGGENARTPNIDQLASESLVFNKAFLSMAMCNPCRTELYTGLYPVRGGSAWNHSAARDGLKSIVHYLSDLGYRVGISGKVHVGPDKVFPFENVNGLKRGSKSESEGTANWGISWDEFLQGLKFQLPPKVEGIYPLATALAAFGIIGMAAGELIFYPYWCLEKGYAKFVGLREDSAYWESRAHGWIRVMKWDAWCSMAVYTVSTVAFYLLGAAVLGRAGLHPKDTDMIRTLSAMYEPVFGEWAVGLFLIGAVVVLYSTFFVNNASSAYVWADAVFQIRGGQKSGTTRYSLHRFFCVALPLLAFVLFCFIPKPIAWIIFAGMMQTLMLPLLGYAAIRFRFEAGSRSFRTRKWGDIMIFVSAFGLFVAGSWLLLTLLFPGIRELG